MIRIERPPNYEAILKAFPTADKHGVLFAYGDDIFNPSNVSIPTWLAAHEYKHCARQFLTSAVVWWEGYLTDQEFRYREELLAHVAELREALGTTRDRNARYKLFDRTARRLIAHLYNYQPVRTLRQALNDIGELF